MQAVAEHELVVELHAAVPQLVRHDPPRRAIEERARREVAWSPLSEPAHDRQPPIPRRDEGTSPRRDRIQARPGLVGVDLVREMFYELPVLVLFIFLGMPEKDVERVKTWSRNRLMLTWGRLSDEQQMTEAKNRLISAKLGWHAPVETPELV